MKRRRFLVSSLAASALAGATHPIEANSVGTAPGETGRRYYELRRYQLRRGPQRPIIDDFLRDAAIPALNRLGIKPVGVFNTTIGPGSPTLYVLLPHSSVESAVTIHDRVAADPEYRHAGAPFINATPTEPAYVRIESFLLRAFTGMPNLELPPGVLEHKSRIFELRTYESHSKRANHTKIEMFNNAEIAIFRPTGLRPVFFGETMFGAGTPSLTYMLTFADLEERTRSWAVFVADPEWKKLSSTLRIADSMAGWQLSTATPSWFKVIRSGIQQQFGMPGGTTRWRISVTNRDCLHRRFGPTTGTTRSSRNQPEEKSTPLVKHGDGLNSIGLRAGPHK
jgi:hypothetical protein